MQRQAASGMRDVPAVVPVDRGISAHDAIDPVTALSPGMESAVPASNSLRGGVVLGIGASNGDPARAVIDVLQPATHAFDTWELKDVLSSVMERQACGDPAWAAELAGQRIVHAIILKLHLYAENVGDESVQPEAVCDALHVRACCPVAILVYAH